MRLRERFFDDRELVEIESLDEGFFGANFCYLVEVLYMKLMCYSIRDEGQIYFIVEREGAKDIADSIIAKKFFPESKKTQVRQGLVILEEMGLVYIDRSLSETRIYIPEVDNMTGKSSKHADEQRRIDRKKKYKEIESSRKEYCLPVGAVGNVYLSDEEYRDIQLKASESGLDLNRLIENVSLIKQRKSDLDLNDYELCLAEIGNKSKAITAL